MASGDKTFMVAASDISATATPNKILKLDANSKLPASITGDADSIDSYHAGTSAGQVLLLDGSALVPLANIPATLTGKDADTLDGNHASAFATSGHNHNSTYLGINATAANATTAGGLAINSSGTNNIANQIVRTDSSGYCNFGWINTTSGDNGTAAISRIYASSDAYLRYYTMANFAAQVSSAPGTFGAKRIVFSTGDPSGGSSGDVWIKYY